MWLSIILPMDWCSNCSRSAGIYALDPSNGASHRQKEPSQSDKQEHYVSREAFSPFERAYTTRTELIPRHHSWDQRLHSAFGLITSPDDLMMEHIHTKDSLQLSNGLFSTQYYNAHCSAIKSQRLEEPVAFRRIDINTGICLFSRNTLPP